MEAMTFVRRLLLQPAGCPMI